MRQYDVAVLLVAALLLCSASRPTAAFYIPGASPTYYAVGDAVHFHVNSVRSTTVVFPKDYYSLPFCKPDPIVNEKDSIGELIWGDRKHNSLYEVKMAVNSSCTLLPGCDAVSHTASLRANDGKELLRLKKHIDRHYRGFMNVDNLPVFNNGTHPIFGECDRLLRKALQNPFQRGYALGVPSLCGSKTLINNHLHFKIYYAQKPSFDLNASDSYMVVGLNAIPYSVRHQDASSCGDTLVLNRATPRISVEDLLADPSLSLYWSYSVEWIPSTVRWATRWDAYFSSSTAGKSSSVHIVYMACGMLVVTLVAGAVASILMRTLRKDIVRYNTLNAEELQEETGWKLVHADVFRPPDRAGLLCIMFGNGVQILFMVSSVVLLSALGFLSPSRRGSLLIAVIMLTVFTAFVGGYACAFLQQYLNCKSWKNVVLSGCVLQGAVCGIYTLTVIIAEFRGSTTAVPFGVILFVFSFWLFVSVPLTVLGASFAFHREPLKNPVQVGRLAREIPVQPLMNHPLMLYLTPPLFPIVTILLEIHFVMQALWAGQVYYVFGFLMLAVILWVLVTALVTVSHLYYVLCYEDHRWWWVAFVAPGCLGLHMFAYSIFFFSQLAITEFASGLLYFLYMGVFSVGYGLATGAIGLAAGILFVRFIYGSIKID